MRDDPAIESQSGSFRVHHAGAATALSASITIEDNLSGSSHVCLVGTVSSGLTVGQAMTAISNNNTDSYIGYSAEL